MAIRCDVEVKIVLLTYQRYVLWKVYKALHTGTAYNIIVVTECKHGQYFIQQQCGSRIVEMSLIAVR